LRPAERSQALWSWIIWSRLSDIWVALAAALLIFPTAPVQGAATEAVGPTQFLMMSDLHFDPMADPKLVDRLSAAEPEEWRAIFESSDNKTPARYGADSNWPLLSSALHQTKVTLPNPGFVILPGDFLAHNFRRQFDAASADHSDPAHRMFVRKTMQFLALQLEQTFPEAPILPALGNDDSYCGNYQLQPQGLFLADTLPIIRGMVGPLGSPGFEQNWISYGNYSVTVRGLRLIFPNTVFFSTNYRNACGSADDADPGSATIAWLETELAAAQQAQQRVWLVYHIPPGVDGFATLRRGSCPDRIVPMWKQTYAEPFYALMRRYSDNVVASFAGHIHMDDFRLLGGNDGYYGFVLVTPALSPIYGQNPAFRTVIFDASGGILDQTTYELANLLDVADRGAPPVWRAEYTFTQVWQLPRIDLASLTQLYAMIATVPADRDRWRQFLPVSSPVYWPTNLGEAATQAALAYRCADGHVLLPEYGHCYCNGGG
jgi:sphingomyelin phosphodiesterase acid-like 3